MVKLILFSIIKETIDVIFLVTLIKTKKKKRKKKKEKQKQKQKEKKRKRGLNIYIFSLKKRLD
jgi:predicted membrane protein